MNKSILRFAFMLLVSFLFIVGTKAQTAGAAISKANLPTPVTVFEDPYQGIPVRIPAMTITRDGGVIAMVDYRHNFSDIGWNSGGTYRLDILMRRSDDGGRTWSPINTVVEGRKDFGYGDPSVVADRDSAGLILMQAVSGNVPYVHATAKNPQHAMFFRSTDGGKTWDKGHDVAPSIYNLYRDEQPLTQEKGFFLTSGKITQSRIIKKDKYYRLYIAHPVLHVGTFVIYSDDFGKTWQVLGGAATIPGPD
ncbi:MAG: sialidase family protein, partial [Hallella sp.]|nr:sialidase family protein [Hallella sp.]